jgi:hypothetical protein
VSGSGSLSGPYLTKGYSAEEEEDEEGDNDDDYYYYDGDDNNDEFEPLNCIRKLCISNLDKDTGYPF